MLHVDYTQSLKEVLYIIFSLHLHFNHNQSHEAGVAFSTFGVIQCSKCFDDGTFQISDLRVRDVQPAPYPGDPRSVLV